jgi:hypothetical protein
MMVSNVTCRASGDSAMVVGAGRGAAGAVSARNRGGEEFENVGRGGTTSS